jgi:hypothetical protein
MAQPIYKVWFTKYKAAWYQLSPEEQSKHNAQIAESLQQVGGEFVIMCASVWASEEWLAWGVEKYPDIEAVQNHAENLYNLKHFEYVESKTCLGAELTLP